jgi:osmotically-inducible protein OsmY
MADRGPTPISEGRMRTDAQILKEVRDELQQEPSLRDAELGVGVRNFVVTLSGHVHSNLEKYAAIRAAERVSGVTALADALDVKLPVSSDRPDSEIARAAANALRWYVQVPQETIRLIVEDGCVTLEGEVEWQYQKTEAERVVQYLRGVKRVVNALLVKPKGASPYEVSRKIKDALMRTAEADADHIRVQSIDGVVTLSGTVRSIAERVEAERAARGAPGVLAVDDRILVETANT